MNYELSKPQEAIYIMSRFAEDSIANIAGDVFFSFNVSIDDAKEAIIDFLNKCDVMHTRIIYVDSKPMQCVYRDYNYNDIPILKFTNDEEYTRWAQNDAQTPIAITGCLYRIFLIDINGKIGLYSVTHHIISDATSFAFIGKYVTRYLKGERNITIYPYYEYLQLEKSYEQTKRYEKDRLFWMEEFQKIEVNYYSTKETRCMKASRYSFILSKNICDIIKSFCGINDISVYSLLFSVLAINYFKKTQREQFFIGTPILNRFSNREENMLGVFVNTVPVGFSIRGDDTFNSFCDKTNDKILYSFRHQKYPYTQLLKDIYLSNHSEIKMFDILFSFWNVKTHDESNANWYSCCSQIESLQIHVDDRKSNGEYLINYDYQTEKFTEEEIEGFHRHFCNLLYDALENPDKKISDLEMISPDEKHKILCDFNSTDHSYGVSDYSTVYNLFEKTAKENKEKICIRTAEKEMSFDDLLNVSEQIDCAIRKITDNKKSVIAVIAERSVEMYAAIYGIIRGGNAYLPIDPEYPEERISYILRNSGACAAAVQNKFMHLAGKVPCINVTGLLGNTVEKLSEVPECNVEADDTAYVIYTSGSTGNPKGAKISHRSAVNRILWMHDKYPLGADDVILQKTPYTFDVSVWEHFWWGMCGGCLAVSKPGEHFLPAKILEEVYKNKVSHLHFVPSVFELFLNYLETHKEEQEKFNSVRYVFLSGEALSASLVQRFYRIYDYSNVTLHNLYGPTECAVDVTYYDCCPTDIDPVPIGRPIYNTQMYVVDKYLNPVPIGVTGELCIAGANVGQGYLNNPELTTEKFVDNPFGEGKLYRTGDLAYWREDGNIVYVGRRDFQIKINGQRIEIGEIESVIGSFDGVDSVAVIVKRVASRDTLVAFYTGRQGNEETIRNHCVEKLPRYMVPCAVVHMDELPLNQNGKLDRKMLAQQPIGINRSVQDEMPVNDIEKFICSTFKSVLGVKDVGRNSDFFELGGNSLSMISLLSEKGFENVSAAEFMRNPSPADIALVMSEKTDNRFDYLEPLYVSEKPTQILFLIPFAGGGAEAYSNFVNEYKRENIGTSVFFIRYLHSFAECEKAANEIASSFKGTELLFYSHCVGSAVALQIISSLEKADVTVKHYFAAASIPPSKPSGKNIWRKLSDGVIKTILIQAGAQIDSLSDERLKELLRRFRSDTDYANICYTQLSEKIKAPTSVVISKKDIFTKNYKQAEKLWSKYVQTVKEISYINSKSHYFQSDDSETLIEILKTTM